METLVSVLLGWGGVVICRGKGKALGAFFLEHDRRWTMLVLCSDHVDRWPLTALPGQQWTTLCNMACRARPFSVPHVGQIYACRKLSPLSINPRFSPQTRFYRAPLCVSPLVEVVGSTYGAFPNSKLPLMSLPHPRRNVKSPDSPAAIE